MAHLRPSFDLPLDECHNCGHKLDRAGAVSSDDGAPIMPKPGDISICIACAAWLVFGDDLKLRLMTAEEMVALDPETHALLLKATAAIKELPNRKEG